MATVFSLLYGRQVDTASNEWREECECAWLLDHKPTRTLKHQFLYGVDLRERLFVHDKDGKLVLAELGGLPASILKKRGLEAADQLLAKAKQLHDARTARAAPHPQPAA